MNNICNVWCDECGNLINENEENSCVVYKQVKGETLVFCSDDCMDDFIKERIEYVYIDINGVIIED